MKRQAKRPAAATRATMSTTMSSAGGIGPDIRALEMLLDYAMMEGAALRLPLFVLLLRTAQLELKTQAGSGASLHGRRHKTKIDQYPGAVERRSFAAPVVVRSIEAAGDAPHGSQPVIQDR